MDFLAVQPKEKLSREILPTASRCHVYVVFV